MRDTTGRRWPWARTALLLLASLLVVGLLIRSVGLENLADETRTADGRLILLASALYGAELVARILRWFLLLPLGSKRARLVIWMIGTGVNELAPSGAGEIVRGLVGRERFGISVSRVIASTAVERLGDVIVLVSLTVFGLLHVVARVPPLVLALPAVGAAAGLVFLVWPQLLARLGLSLRTRGGIWRRASFLEHLASDLASVRGRPTALFAAWILTLAVWGLEGGAQWVMLQSVGVTMDALTVLGIVAIAYAAGFVSFLPGGLGSREAVFIGLLVAAGAPSAASAAAVLTFRAGQTTLVLLLGAIAAVATGLRPKVQTSAGSGAVEASEAEPGAGEG